MRKNYYEFLGVSPDAGIEEIKQACYDRMGTEPDDDIGSALHFLTSARTRMQYDKDLRKQEAPQRTQEAAAAVESLENILSRSLETEHTVNWDSLKEEEVEFSKPQPVGPKPLHYLLGSRPERGDKRFQAGTGIMGAWRSSSKKEQRIREADERYEDALRKYEAAVEGVDKCNSRDEAAYREKRRDWEDERKEFRSREAKKNSRIDEQKSEYMRKVPDAVSSYCDTVLSDSDYPDCFPKDFELEYSSESKILIVNYALPTIEDMPRIKEVKYVQSRDELVEVARAESAINKLYDSAIYQTALRTVHEVFDADEAKAIDAVVFNGWVTSIDKATGQEVRACIVSVLARHSEFTTINLANVDPKLCFKKLKGVGSAKLHGLVPVAPILDMSRDDRRFIPSYEVAGDLDESTNIAAMPWQDFEHLIRELLEKEFASVGGEVRITQASRDRGVDAIVFDPDPVRGGKMVIQAKRYTNTVGVSAVRELHGTVLNEGAMKGILVTTADYGADAYEYAKDKPLTLLNGSNLLHLLEKHGHRATIDLKAAKKLLAEQEDRSP